jgi:hypothetical protein
MSDARAPASARRCERRSVRVNAWRLINAGAHGRRSRSSPRRRPPRRRSPSPTSKRRRRVVLEFIAGPSAPWPRARSKKSLQAKSESALLGVADLLARRLRSAAMMIESQRHPRLASRRRRLRLRAAT